jgi:hypothetical protein
LVALVGMAILVGELIGNGAAEGVGAVGVAGEGLYVAIGIVGRMALHAIARLFGIVNLAVVHIFKIIFFIIALRHIIKRGEFLPLEDYYQKILIHNY